MYIGCNYINCLHLVDVWAQCDECEVSIVLVWLFTSGGERFRRMDANIDKQVYLTTI